MKSRTFYTFRSMLLYVLSFVLPLELIPAADFDYGHTPASSDNLGLAEQIANVATKLEQSEVQAQRIANSLVKSNDGLDTQQDTAIRAQLRRQVSKSFALQQQIHHLELQLMDERLVLAKEKIESRSKFQKEIVDRRINALLNPEVVWGEVHVRQGIGTMRQEPVSTKDEETPQDEFAGFRSYLWDSLGPLQNSRNAVLAEIVEIERRLIELTSEPTEDDGSDEQQKLAARIDQATQQLREQIELLQNRRRSYENQIQFLKGQLRETQSHAREFQVTDVDKGTALLSGHDRDSLQVGQELAVFHDSQYVGDVEIVEKQNESTLAVIAHRAEGMVIERGDVAVALAPALHQSPGESIYNEKLKRFKFHLEDAAIENPVEFAMAFTARYRGDRSNPPIIGAWADPSTNSIVVVGPPEADQPLREFIARGRAARFGIEPHESDDSLEGQRQALAERRVELIEEKTRYQLELLDIEHSDTSGESDQLPNLKELIKRVDNQMQIIHRKLAIVEENLALQNENARPSSGSPL